MYTLLFFQFLLTLFISGGLFFKENKLKNKTISIYFLLFAFEILYFIYGTTKIALSYPQFVGRFYFSLGLLYGPILFFHFKAVIDSKFHFKIIDLIHFIPLLAVNIFMIDILLLSNIDRVAYFNNADNFYNCIMNLNYTRALHQIVYGIIFIIIFLKKNNNLGVDKKLYLSGMTIIYFVTTIVISLFTLFANSWHDFKWYYILCNTFIFLIVYVLYKDPKFFKNIKKKYASSSLTNSEMKSIKQNIEKLFLEKSIFLNNDFNINSLASELNTKSNYISRTFTELLKENFNDYVNKHRIKHAKKLLKNSDYNHLKIEAIAQESGFNNKVTFYKAFSKFENTTPSIYRKAKKNKK